MKKTLKEALELIQELDYVPGVSMAVPDFNYTVGKRRNFDPTDHDDDFPYDEEGDGVAGGPQNAQGDGQSGIGRGGVGWGGRPDHSGGVRQPSATYQSTWDTTDEGAEWDEEQRHGGDRRNLWRDTPDGKTLKHKIDQDEEELGEAMGTPTQTGPVAPMDGPQHNVLNFSGSIDDMLPKDPELGPATQWGGSGMVPGTSGGWATDPSAPDRQKFVPEEGDMKLKEFFDPAPPETEPLENQGQDYMNDATDDEIETKIDVDVDTSGDEHAGSVEEPEGDDEPQSFSGRYGGETLMMIPNVGKGVDFVMSPDKFGAARGTYGMQADGKDKSAGDMLDKRSAWDVLQRIVMLLGAPPEKPENQDNDGISS